jgi:hypothetical protein
MALGLERSWKGEVADLPIWSLPCSGLCFAKKAGGDDVSKCVRTIGHR